MNDCWKQAKTLKQTQSCHCAFSIPTYQLSRRKRKTDQLVRDVEPLSEQYIIALRHLGERVEGCCAGIYCM